MRIFFDTEFTGLHQNTTLISIGLVAADGKRFYGELTDYDESQCNEWIEKNVLDHLILSGNDDLAKALGEDENTTVVLGCAADVANELREWLEQYRLNGIQFVSDVCHYDMVLLVDLLWGEATEMPKFVTPFCRDVAQDMVNKLGMTEEKAFDLSREQFLIDRKTALPKGQKHNSLYDAEVIKEIYNCLDMPFV